MNTRHAIGYFLHVSGVLFLCQGVQFLLSGAPRLASDSLIAGNTLFFIGLFMILGLNKAIELVLVLRGNLKWFVYFCAGFWIVCSGWPLFGIAIEIITIIKIFNRVKNYREALIAIECEFIQMENWRGRRRDYQLEAPRYVFDRYSILDGWF